MRLVTFSFLILLALTAPAIGSPVEAATQAVESIRGLKFREPVTVEAISRDQLRPHLHRQIAKTLPYSLEEYVDILTALQLVDEPRTSILPALFDLLQQQVLAFYDPYTRTYYTVDGLPDALELPRAVVEIMKTSVEVHELTHALQDQHFAIGQRDLALRNDWDASLAYHALIEGEATLVMLAHIAGGGPRALETLLEDDSLVKSLAAAAAMDVGGTGDAPRYLVESLKFPYLEGLKFVIAGYRRGGWDEINRMHRRPPQSTREIFRPEEYFARRDATERVDAFTLPRGRYLLTRERLGEFHWNFILGRPATGWVDDGATILQNATCDTTVLLHTRWESENDAARFASSFQQIADTRGVGAFVVTAGRRVLIGYGPDEEAIRLFLKSAS